jgi:single-strand DNA-binding protein
MKKSSEWHNLVVRNKAAEMCEKYLTKGDKIYVEGLNRVMANRRWYGQTYYRNSSNRVYFLSTKKGRKQQTNSPTESQKTLTLTHKITACQSMICRFDCLTNLLIWTQSPV